MAFLRTFFGLIVVFLCGAEASGQTNFTANSYAQLKVLSGLSNANITMAPGEYWVTGDSSQGTLLNLSGSNNTFDFSQATFKVDTRNLAGFSGDFDVMQINGSDVTVNGLKLYGEDVDLDTDPDARRYPNRAGNYLNITGDNAELNNAHIITAGSNPYGFGDAFGKGAPPSCRDLPAGAGGCAYVGHNKVSGILLNGWGTGAKIDGLDLDMNTFGHGVYIQGFDDIEIRNSSVTGQLFSSNDVINHPAYQEYGVNAYNQEMFPDILISGSEDGIRYYGDGNNLDWSENLIIDNVEVTNMREAFSLIAARGTVTVNNASAYGNETGFEPGLGTVITNSRADVTNGPLLFYRRNYVENTDVEIELVGDIPQVGRTWDVAYINGDNNVVTLTSDIDPNLLSDEAYVRVGQRFNDWRHNLGDLDNTSLPADGLVLNNLTGQITVLGTNTDDISGFSSAGTVNTGDDNYYDGLTLVLAGTKMVLDSNVTLGNNGTAADGSLETNASIVYNGATLELNPGIRISNEKLTISGDGVDGKGALYSDGQTGTGTRFGSSNGSDESTVYLDGDASIGVGIAGSQMLVGRIQGTGNLTKLGAGKLSVEKSSALIGDIIVAEGEIAARSGVAVTGLTVQSGARFGQIQSNAVNTTQAVLLDGTLDLNNTNGTGTNSATVGALSGSGLVEVTNTTATGMHTLTINSDAAADFAGNIVSNISLSKTGPGTQILSGTNFYAGTTLVSEGALLIDGTHTGGDTYTVAGGILGGNGSINTDITIESGGTLAPGASAGQLTVEQLVFQTGSLFEIEIGGLTAGSEYDQLIGESITLAGDLALSLLDLGSGLFLPDPSDTFSVLDATSLSGMFDNVVSGTRLDTTGGEGSFLVTYDSASDAVVLSDFALSAVNGDYNGDGDVDGSDFLAWQRDDGSALGLSVWTNNYGVDGSLASVTAVPEPGTALLLAMGVVACLSRNSIAR